MTAIHFEWKDTEADELEAARDGVDPFALTCVSFRQMLPLPAVERQKTGGLPLPEGTRRKPLGRSVSGATGASAKSQVGGKGARTR